MTTPGLAHSDPRPSPIPAPRKATTARRYTAVARARVVASPRTPVKSHDSPVQPMSARYSPGLLYGRLFAVGGIGFEQQIDPGLHSGNRIEGAVTSDVDPVAEYDLLKAGHDGVGAMDVRTHQLLQPVVAVEAASALADLGDPRPDVRRRRSDGQADGCV